MATVSSKRNVQINCFVFMSAAYLVSIFWQVLRTAIWSNFYGQYAVGICPHRCLSVRYPQARRGDSCRVGWHKKNPYDFVVAKKLNLSTQMIESFASNTIRL